MNKTFKFDPTIHDKMNAVAQDVFDYVRAEHGEENLAIQIGALAIAMINTVANADDCSPREAITTCTEMFSKYVTPTSEAPIQ